ncbi:MAG: FCD domain-containing protein [Gammaproteobacteria bacterium]|jgi:DNA-binding FadR family transcriptional regulator|nr:FCD domain-containing protein [Gammaproteobacteria bacterium]
MTGKPTIAEIVAKQLEDMIAEGALQVGVQLPSERVLAERLEVSRPTLREAKQILTSKGLLSSRQGGGTYVTTSLNSSLTDPLTNLLSERAEFRYDILELRHTLDSEAAFLAATRATALEKNNIKEKYEAMISLHLKADDHVASAIADIDFHLSITEASHNIALLHVTRSIYDVLLSSIENNLQYLYTIKGIEKQLTEQHKLIMESILNGDSNEAKTAAKKHMEFVNESLSVMDKEKERHSRFLHHTSVLSKPQKN